MTNSRKFSLGQRLKELRSVNQWTLSDVSQLTGISVTTLSNLENGKTSLNFNKVLQLTEGLGIDLADLMDDRSVVVAKTRMCVTRDGEGHSFQAHSLFHRVLGGDLAQTEFLAHQVTVTAKSAEEFGEFSRHPGEEFLFVLSGQLSFLTEHYQPVLLSKGDSVFFDCSMGHAYLSSGDEKTEILLVNSNAGLTD